MAKKKATPKKKAPPKKRVSSTNDELQVLLNSQRRCCLCFGLNDDDEEKIGQIAHIDGNPANSKEQNLAFLCQRHHSLFDTITSQHKGLTQGELKHYRKKLYDHLKEKEKKAREKKQWQEDLERKRAEQEAEKKAELNRIRVKGMKDHQELMQRKRERFRNRRS